MLRAETGQQGIDLLRARRDIDLILMDVMMPELDGIETIRMLRREPRFASMPMIAVTAKPVAAALEPRGDS